MLAVDEKSQIQAIDRTAPILPIMPTTPARRTHDYVRHGMTSLFSALDVVSGSGDRPSLPAPPPPRVPALPQAHRHGRPAELDLHLVLDNHATHKTLAVKNRLIPHPQLHLHFTPTSSSWLNLVERWFAKLTTRKLGRSAHSNMIELEGHVHRWINEWNANPKPFVWTKTADRILGTLAAYCQRLMTQDTRRSADSRADRVSNEVHLARSLVMLFPLTTTFLGSGASHTASPPKPVDALESYLETWHGADRFAESVQLQQQPNPMWRQEARISTTVAGNAAWAGDQHDEARWSVAADQ